MHDVTQEKKLKNWYIQEYTTGTTFEPNILKSDDDDGGKNLHDEWTGYSEHMLPYEWIAKMNGWWCGWKLSKRNIILLRI